MGKPRWDDSKALRIAYAIALVILVSQWLALCGGDFIEMAWKGDALSILDVVSLFILLPPAAILAVRRAFRSPTNRERTSEPDQSPARSGFN